VLETLEDDASALGAAALTIPLRRPVGFLLLRVSTETGAFHGLVSPVGTPRILHADRDQPVVPEPVERTPSGVVGPLAKFSGTLPHGGMFLALCASMHKGAETRLAEEQALSEYLRRNRTDELEPMELAADAATWARGKLPALSSRDLCVLLVQRKA